MLLISCASSDHDALQTLRTALKPACASQNVRVCDTFSLLAGADVQKEMERFLQQARIILLVLTPDYLASEPCAKEWQAALKQRQERATIVIPIRWRAVAEASLPSELAGLQSLPRGNQNIRGARYQAQALSEVVDEIARHLVMTQAIADSRPGKLSPLPTQFEECGAGNSASSGPSKPPGLAYDPRYYVRRGDHESLARQMLEPSAGAVVLQSPEWCGKTWMLEHLLSTCNQQDVLIHLDAKELSQSTVTSDLNSFLRELSCQIYEDCPTDMKGSSGVNALLEAAFTRSPNAMINMRWFMEQNILSNLKSRRLILAIDSVDVFVKQPWCDEFFSMLRSWQLRTQPIWSGIRFLFTMSTAPNLLVKDIHQSPFNGASKILLSDFTTSQIGQIATLHGLHCSESEANKLLLEIGGHPYLLALTCYHARRAGLSLADWLPDSGPVFAPFLARANRGLHADPKLYAAFEQAVRHPKRRIDFHLFDRLCSAGYICKSEDGDTYSLRFPIYRRLLKPVL